MVNKNFLLISARNQSWGIISSIFNGKIIYSKYVVNHYFNFKAWTWSDNDYFW